MVNLALFTARQTLSLRFLGLVWMEAQFSLTSNKETSSCVMPPSGIWTIELAYNPIWAHHHWLVFHHVHSLVAREIVTLVSFRLADGASWPSINPQQLGRAAPRFRTACKMTKRNTLSFAAIQNLRFELALCVRDAKQGHHVRSLLCYLEF